MNKKIKFRVSIGLVTGSILLGGATYTLISLHKGKVIIPFYQENTKSYAVNSKTYYIDSIDKGLNDVIEQTDKMYLTEDELENVKKIELSASSPWVMEEEKRGKVFTRDNYQCNFDYEELTSKEVDEKLKLFEYGKLEELVKDCNWSSTYSEKPFVVSSEELEKDTYSANMTIYNIDYNDIKTEKQTKEENKKETIWVLLMSFIGGTLGLISEINYNIENNIEYSKQKTKKRIM